MSKCPLKNSNALVLKVLSFIYKCFDFIKENNLNQYGKLIRGKVYKLSKIFTSYQASRGRLAWEGARLKIWYSAGSNPARGTLL